MYVSFLACPDVLSYICEERSWPTYVGIESADKFSSYIRPSAPARIFKASFEPGQLEVIPGYTATPRPRMATLGQPSRDRWGKGKPRMQTRHGRVFQLFLNWPLGRIRGSARASQRPHDQWVSTCTGGSTRIPRSLHMWYFRTWCLCYEARENVRASLGIVPISRPRGPETENI